MGQHTALCFEPGTGAVYQQGEAFQEAGGPRASASGVAAFVRSALAGQGRGADMMRYRVPSNTSTHDDALT